MSINLQSMGHVTFYFSLPKAIQTWKFLPLPLRSLKPYDRGIVKVKRLAKKTPCLRNTHVEDNENIKMGKAVKNKGPSSSSSSSSSSSDGDVPNDAEKGITFENENFKESGGGVERSNGNFCGGAEIGGGGYGGDGGGGGCGDGGGGDGGGCGDGGGGDGGGGDGGGGGGGGGC